MQMYTHMINTTIAIAEASIQQAYDIQEAQYHKDDATSVNVWVDAMKSNSPNPVLLYKQQGEPPPVGCQSLELNDFILVL